MGARPTESRKSFFINFYPSVFAGCLMRQAASIPYYEAFLWLRTTLNRASVSVLSSLINFSFELLCLNIKLCIAIRRYDAFIPTSLLS